MSPSGAITYVSSMWGGRAGDKLITQESDKLLMSLKPGDKVMVDRGFTIAKELLMVSRCSFHHSRTASRGSLQNSN